MCQTVWTQIRTNTQSVLICVQTVCKVYQQMTKVAASKERVQMALQYQEVSMPACQNDSAVFKNVFQYKVINQ